MAVAGGASSLASCATGKSVSTEDFYQSRPFGNVRLLHITDTHAQLLPVYFREPNVNIGMGDSRGQLPHVVGEALLREVGVQRHTRSAHAFSYLDFEEAALRYGKVGGFSHLGALVKRLRGESGEGASLLLDGGDTWQGSGTAFWTRGMDMVGACNLLGVDIMTGHWEFTYREEEVLANIAAFNGEFVAQNIRVTEDALFEGVPAFDEDSGHAFKPYTLREVGGRKIAVIGQAFPYTPIANPSRFIPNWTFGIRAADLQELVDTIRAGEAPDAVILLSHDGMDVDIKLAATVSGIDAILGGHTHDGMPVPVIVSNAGGKTIVTNAGSNGKFIGVLDLDITDSGIRDFRYRLLPVFSNLLAPDREMEEYIARVRAPYLERLREPLAKADSLLYRRGNFNGTFDQIICDAQRIVGDAQIALSPGFRWGTTVLPGETITMEHVLDQTCITYPETYVREMPGSQIKLILEDVCDNLFHPDPFYQQGGDMVRLGGMDYICDPAAPSGNRISSMTLDDGTAIDPDRTYKVAGWATVGSVAPGPPIWDVVAEYLRSTGVVRIDKLNTPVLRSVKGNPGLADYSGTIES
jgi:sulfur-oxidizing protein SoxB